MKKVKKTSISPILGILVNKPTKYTKEAKMTIFANCEENLRR